METIENTESFSIIKDIEENIIDGDYIYIIAESFSVFLFENLKNQLDKVSEIKILISDESLKSFFDDDFDISLSQRLETTKIVFKFIELLKSKKVRIKQNNCIRSCNLITKNYAYELNRNAFSFSAKNLGFSLDENNNDRNRKWSKEEDKDDYSYTKSGFTELWQDRKSVDITEQFAEELKKVVEVSPNDVYYYSLQELFKNEIGELKKTPALTNAFQNSKIYKEMYEFQKHAAEDIIHRLDTLGVCILADSVGLGKTFTALGVIKKYLLDGKSVLVLCPKKLENNWKSYLHADKDNFLKEKFNYDLFFHTDLGRVGTSWDGRDLEHIYWDSFGLVVIDESHNFRTGLKFDKDKHIVENRYSFLMNKVLQGAVKSKLLLLSATPVNNRFKDMENQLELASSSKDLSEILLNGKPLPQIFKKADSDFNKWLKSAKGEKTTDSLMRSLDPDFIHFIESVSIARSRSHIKKFYGENPNLNFPNRLKPISIAKYEDYELASDQYRNIAETLLLLNLSIYSITDFIKPEFRNKYRDLFEDKEIAEKRGNMGQIITLMRSNILKRLESSAFSFDKTLTNIQTKIETALEKIERYKSAHETSIFENDDVENYYEGEDDLIQTSKKYKISISHLDGEKWSNELIEDLEVLNKLKEMATDFIKTDAKLNKLKQIITDKITHPNPKNGNNKKIIVFTAFSDTAKELYDKLKDFMKEKFNIETALVTGSLQVSTLSNANSFDKILTFFSPKSKHKEELYTGESGEIDLLIATDCISEGQNLQDCDYLINYDIHWNPTRIIQRFGRIDRIGSVNKEIQLVNFWPSDDLNLYIKLKSRVEGRMAATDLSGTALDNPLTDNSSEDDDYRAEQIEKNLKRDFEDIKNGKLDPKNSFAISDTSPIGYKNEYKNYLAKIKEENLENRTENLPNGICTVIQSNESLQKGVIFLFKEKSDETQKSYSSLYPYQFVYITENGKPDTDSIAILSRIRDVCNGNTVVESNKLDVPLDVADYLEQAMSALEEKENDDNNTNAANGNVDALINIFSDEEQKKLELVDYFIVR